MWSSPEFSHRISNKSFPKQMKWTRVEIRPTDSIIPHSCLVKRIKYDATEKERQERNTGTKDKHKIQYWYLQYDRHKQSG